MTLDGSFTSVIFATGAAAILRAQAPVVAGVAGACGFTTEEAEADGATDAPGGSDEPAATRSAGPGSAVSPDDVEHAPMTKAASAATHTVRRALMSFSLLVLSFS
ncbi:hypothetical protein Ait01nite_047840 [Actinoplanes italicus]|nr:hypothetical protein Ait01nite_047840 [Actinoplanes italicus]